MVAAPPRSRVQALYDAAEAVVGQKRARQQLAVLLDRQWKVAEGRLDKSGGVILFGQSGSGKSYTARLMCRHSGLPFAEVNATRYTEAGYSGLDLQHMFLPLIEDAARLIDERRHGTRVHLDQAHHQSSVLKRGDIDEVVALAQTGVVLLDEFDKWMLRFNHVTGLPDTAIQADLLKMVEGSIEMVSDVDDDVGVPFDTTRVLVICAGAFVRLYRQVLKRMGGEADEKSMMDEQFWNQIEPEDFERFGLLPELTGRLSTHIFTRPLRDDHYRAILLQGHSKLAEYRQAFEDTGCEWAVSEAGLIHIANMAKDLTTGARALDHLLSKMFDLALYEASVAESHCRVVLEPMMPYARVEKL